MMLEGFSRCATFNHLSMESTVSLFTLRAERHGVGTQPWSFGKHLSYPGVFQQRNLLKAGPRLTLPMLPERLGKPRNLQIYAAKPGFGPQPKKKKKTKKAERMPRVKEEEDSISKAKKILSRKEQKLQEDPRVKEEEDPTSKAKKVLSRKEQKLQEDPGNTFAEQAPSLAVHEDTQSYDPIDEEQFERRLAEIKREAEEQKVLAEQKKYGPIDYDAPLPSSQNGAANNLGAKIGIGVAVVVFGLVFALGDFLPSGRPNSEKSSLVEKSPLSKEDISKLQAQVKEFEDELRNSPEDRAALEGAAVSYAELGEFEKAAKYLSKILQKSPGDVEVLRLLAEVQNGKADYDASISSYRAAIRASGKKGSLTLLQGLVDTLLAAKQPSEAVGELLAARARLNDNLEQMKSVAQPTLSPPASGDSVAGEVKGDAKSSSQADDQIDPVTVELLLGKAYTAWTGHTGDAATVYDGLIANYPNDYRGYLAKGVLLKGQDKKADAERMFIQARYLAPPNSKSIVDVYSGRRSS